MKLIQIKNKLNISIINEKLKDAKQLKIQSAWKKFNANENNTTLSKTFKFQDELKQIKDPLKNNAKSFSVELSQKVLKLNKKNGINAFSSNNVIGLLSLNIYENKDNLFNSLNKVNSKTVSFWFFQLKSFFLKMPSDNLDTWFLKSSEIQHLINLNYLNTWNIISIPQKAIK